MTAPVCTTCPYCGVGCGVVAEPDGLGGAAISGDPEHPANFGRLCSKGSALGQTLDLEGRLLAPKVFGQDADWNSALELVASRFQAAIKEHGPDSVAFYVSGQLLIEDYYVANKLMKGFIGSANIDTNSRLCMASSVAGHKRAFGSDTVPGSYEDLEEADLVVLVGSNLAWCHPVLHQRLLAARETRGTKIVNIDPRRTATSDTADLHLGLKAGSDVALFAGLLGRILERSAEDRAWIAAHVEGAPEAFSAALTLSEAAEATGIDPTDLAAFYDLWIDTDRVVTVYSQGVNQAADGSDKVNAILNCHLATGRVGTPGCGPFSVTGQPNAMGGREVGGLANMLANHLAIENPAHRSLVQDFWQAPTMAEAPGLKAVDLFEACAKGEIKALWVMCTNPAVSMPATDHVARAIETCPFVVVSDMMEETDTSLLADVCLPATGWGEKDGTVTNSERRISRQRRFLPAPGGARDDWRIICDVAARMGHGAAFAYDGPGAIFEEYAALSAEARIFGVDLDLSGLQGLSGAAYDALKPVQWPVPESGAPGGRFFAEGGFFTPDGKARMLALRPAPEADAPSGFPLRLNTGRVRDHWHTMTRTAKSERLSQHIAEPYIEIHPLDARREGIEDAALVRIDSAEGRMIARARLTDRVPEGQLFAPMHWNGQWSAKGRVNAATGNVVDPVSGQPALKGAYVKISAAKPIWYAFAISRQEPKPSTEYWAKARVDGGWRVELASETQAQDWQAYAEELLGVRGADLTSMVDPASGRVRLAYHVEGRIEAAFFADREPVRAARAYLSAALSAEDPPGAEIVAGIPSLNRPDPGAIVCSCFGVGINTIRAAIAENKAMSVDEIGALLQAGTNCGSCRPEIKAIVNAASLPLAAE